MGDKFKSVDVMFDAAIDAGMRGLCLYVCIRCLHRQEDVRKDRWRCNMCGAEYDSMTKEAKDE